MNVWMVLTMLACSGSKDDVTADDAVVVFLFGQPGEILHGFRSDVRIKFELERALVGLDDHDVSRAFSMA